MNDNTNPNMDDRPAFTPGLNPARPWHGGDPLLKIFRLNELHKNGYIDWPGPGPFPGVTNDYSDEDPGAINNITRVLEPPIHPAFERTNFILDDPKDYDHLYPALRLASSLLYNSFVLQFFNGLLKKPMALIDNDEAKARLGTSQLRHFDSIANDGPDFLMSKNTFARLCDMYNRVRFSFKDISTLGDTGRRDAYGSYDPHGFHSAVQFKADFLRVIKGQRSINDFAKAEHFDVRVGLMRTHFLLAMALVHEFTHAVGIATHQRPPDLADIVGKRYEPFFRNDTCAELGWSFQQAIFGASTYPAGLNPSHSPAAAYGIYIFNFPGDKPAQSWGGIAADIIDPDAPIPPQDQTPFDLLKSPYNAPVTAPGHPNYQISDSHDRPTTVYSMVPTKDIYRFFTRRFWEVDVPASGDSGAAFVIPWRLPMRRSRDAPVTVDPASEPNRRPHPFDPSVLTYRELANMGWKLKHGDETSSDDGEDDDSSGDNGDGSSGGNGGGSDVDMDDGDDSDSDYHYDEDDDDDEDY